MAIVNIYKFLRINKNIRKIIENYMYNFFPPEAAIQRCS